MRPTLSVHHRPESKLFFYSSRGRPTALLDWMLPQPLFFTQFPAVV